MAKDYYKSNFAINKKSKAIVYKMADGSVLEITYQKISESNPEFTEQDFEMFKKLSDEMYLTEARRDKVEADHKVIIYDNEAYDTHLSTPTLEELFFGQAPDDVPSIEQIYKTMDICLTKTQKRRLLLNRVQGMTTVEISKMEGVGQKNNLGKYRKR